MATKEIAKLSELEFAELEAELATLAAHLYAATCRSLELVGELDRRGNWSEAGVGFSAEFLAWRCALSSRPAREHLTPRAAAPRSRSPHARHRKTRRSGPVTEAALASPEASRPGGERYQLVLHAERAVLANDGDGECAFEPDRAGSIETAGRCHRAAALLRAGEPDNARGMGAGLLDSQEFDRWRAEADRALAAARLQADAGLHNWACFAAEQAAQLAAKALLHGLGRAPWGHDLVALGELIAAAGIEVPSAERDATRRLGRHYIPARYPDAHASGPASAHYGAADAADAIGDAERILAFIDTSWRGLE